MEHAGPHSCIKTVLLALLCAFLTATPAASQSTHCSESEKLENPPDATRCSKLIKFFSSHPDCSHDLHKRCCAASDSFFTSNCACATGASDAMLETVDNLHSDCLQEATEANPQHTKGAKDSKLAAGAALLDKAAQALRLRAKSKQHPQPIHHAIRRGRPAAELLAKVHVFVGVLSSSTHKDRRDAIRATWGKSEELHRVMFFVSRPKNDTLFADLRHESVQFGDMVVLGHVWEAYDNITYQTFEMCRAAALDLNVTHLLKVDDDSFVRPNRLVDELAVSPSKYLFMGFMEWHQTPHRDPNNQWYVSKEEWAEESFPPWAHGTGYVLSIDLVREIAAGVPYALRPDRLFKLEDVSMGSWVDGVAKEQHIQVDYVHNQRFNFWGCSVRDIVSHYITPKRQICMFKRNGKCCRKG